MKLINFIFAALLAPFADARDESVFCRFSSENRISSCIIEDQIIVDDGGNRDVQADGGLNPDTTNEDIRAVRIRRGSIPFIVTGFFTRFPNIFRLIIESNLENGIRRIQTGAFANAGNIQWIMITENPLTTIQANAFAGASSLRTLDLRRNQIERISVFAFNGLSNLRDLMLESNRIFHIQGNLFKPLLNVQLIYLSVNQIESIEGRTFANNREIRHIDLTRNPVQEIERNILDNLDNLEIFIAAENDCVSDAWIVAPLDEIREGLNTCFENFDNVQ